MASRKLTPGSYVVFIGLMILALVVAVISFIVPFSIYGSAGHEEEGAEAHAEAAEIDLMFTPEAPANAEAAREFQSKILGSYSQVGVPESTEEATVEPTEEATVEATEEATVEPTEEATIEPTEEATAEPTVEGTVEATEEATVEATEEATVEPTLEATVEAAE
ncbi:MAG: hypothetical protein KDJ65_16895 [Anaerolineae bacterium]|nr:hypothetical protein [Anaerolineae bacterium]